MGGIDHQDINAGGNKGLNALLGSVAHPHSSSHAKLSLLVAGRMRVFNALENVFHGNESAQLKLCVDHQHTLESVMVHE